MNEEDNPWHVTDLEEFLYYCCPECDEKNQSKESFLEHALEQHPKSKNCISKFAVKEELIEYEDEENSENYVAKEEFNYNVLDLECNVEILDSNNEYGKRDAKLGYERSEEISDYKYEIDPLDVKPDIKSENSINQEKPSKKKPCKCEICGKVLSERYKLNLHIKNVHGKPRKDYKSITYKNTIKRQAATKKDNKKKSCECELCGKILSEKYKLNLHMKIVHERQKDYKCETCGYECGYEYTLRKHIMAVHEKSTESICEICGKTFRDKFVLKKHIRTVHKFHKENGDEHKTNNLYECKTCGETFTDQYVFRDHRRTVHDEDKKYVCEVCGQKFVRLIDMKNHVISIHEKPKQDPNFNEKQLANMIFCKLCGKTFTRVEGLRNHMKGVHEGINRAKCDICGKPFRTQDAVNLHKKSVHEGIKVKCDICFKDFSQQSAVTKHKRNIHKINPGVTDHTTVNNS